MSLPAKHRSGQARRALRGVGVSPALALFSLCTVTTFASAAEPPLKDRPFLRRPIAAAWIEPGKLLAVANQRSGTVSIVDIPGRKVRDEIAVGERLADIAALPNTGRLLALDAKRHEMIMLLWKQGRLTVEDRMEITPHPVSLAVVDDGALVTVASLWSRKLSIWAQTRLVPRYEIPYLLRGEVGLSFNPRSQCLLAPDKLLVADAFGGNVAVVDLQNLRVISSVSIPGHNIRGMDHGPDPEHLLIAHQRLRPTASTEENILTGSIVENLLGEYNLVALTRATDDGMLRGFTNELGYAEHGRADPALVRQLSGKRSLVVVAGTGELRILPEFGVPPYKSVFVGNRATRIAFYDEPAAAKPDDTLLNSNLLPQDMFDVVLNADSDTLSLLAWNPEEETTKEPRRQRVPFDPTGQRDRGALPIRGDAPRIAGEILLGPTSEKSPAERGEELFYDARLSAGGWMSCHSCHTDGHTNGQLADTLSDGTYGTPKRVPSLLGTRLSDPWAWNGGVRELHEQVQKSLENTMHAPKFTPQDVLDITAFLHTLPPPPPLEPATKAPRDIEQLARGEALFGKLGCAKCHVPPLTYTSSEVYDVGLEDEKGQKKFNPPSLRGVSQGYSFFHDGRAKSLEAVFTEHAHGLSRPLDKDELADLLRFLRSL